MSPATKTLERRHSRRPIKNEPFRIWPVLVGMIFAFAALSVENILTASGNGVWGMRLLFPTVLLVKRPELALPSELATNLSQLMLYLQFPLEGLLAALTLRRRSLGKTIFSALLTHMLVVLVLVMLVVFGKRHLEL